MDEVRGLFDPNARIVTAWHKLALIVALQNINRSIAYRVPDRRFIGCFQTLDVQYLCGAGAFGKATEQSRFLRPASCFPGSPPLGLGASAARPRWS
jgi:hypothetical protein